jgi:hypothetical protein
MAVTIRKQVVIEPTNSVKELLMEIQGDNVTLTAVFDDQNKASETVPWKDLWNSTFFKDKVSGKRDGELNAVTKLVQMGDRPSTLRLFFRPTGGYDMVTINTGDLRKALRALR